MSAAITGYAAHLKEMADLEEEDPERAPQIPTSAERYESLLLQLVRYIGEENFTGAMDLCCQLAQEANAIGAEDFVMAIAHDFASRRRPHLTLRDRRRLRRLRAAGSRSNEGTIIGLVVGALMMLFLALFLAEWVRP
jgi:hypothetical protein